MTKVTCDMATSLDGYVAGPSQSEADPLWMFEEREVNAAALEAMFVTDGSRWYRVNDEYGDEAS